MHYDCLITLGFHPNCSCQTLPLFVQESPANGHSAYGKGEHAPPAPAALRSGAKSCALSPAKPSSPTAPVNSDAKQNSPLRSSDLLVLVHQDGHVIHMIGPHASALPFRGTTVILTLCRHSSGTSCIIFSATAWMCPYPERCRCPRVYATCVRVSHSQR